MADLTTFALSDIIEMLAAQDGFNVACEGIDDEVYGLLIAGDKTLTNFLQQHMGPLNFQVIDGDPIRVVRRAVNDDLVIDLEVSQADCIVKQSGNGASSPAILFDRQDVSTIPRDVEIQYYDPDRVFAVTTQLAHNEAAPKANPKVSIALDLCLSADQARAIALEYLFRMWARPLELNYELPDLRIEPGDVHRVTCDQGVFVVLVQQATYTPDRTTVIKATALQQRSGYSISGGTSDSDIGLDQFAAWLLSN